MSQLVVQFAQPVGYAAGATKFQERWSGMKKRERALAAAAAAERRQDWQNCLSRRLTPMWNSSKANIGR